MRSRVRLYFLLPIKYADYTRDNGKILKSIRS